MRIPGTEPSSVILSQTCTYKKLKSKDQKGPKQAEAKRDGVTNHESTEVDHMCPRGLTGPPAVTLTK